MKLSICIPTWNRAEKLKECLNKFISQIVELEDEVEIIVSDNASTDNTKDIMYELCSKHGFIKYFSNEVNLGFDGNFLSLINYANGEYIFFCSDDDVLLEEGLRKILNIIKQNEEFSLLSLNYYSFKGTNPKIKYVTYKSSGKDIYFNDPNEHIKFVSYNLGFISSIVINAREAKTIIKGEKIKDSIGSGFVQISLMLSALSTDKRSVWVGDYIIAQRTDTGGWFPLKYFAYELPRIYLSFQDKGYTEHAVKKVINEALLKLVLPGLIAWRCNYGDEEVIKTKKLIVDTHSKNPLFWFAIYPFYIIPRPLLKFPFTIMRYCKRRLKGVNQT
ncbi:glycosyltransferase family 2 protein [Paenibacillus tengchongensis]|uniref:glycosyltransferase family 2 protein n=1 Tax=Paenibacillus tengchongensis TaxID=2608684 RepID=UPI00124DAFB4|nr:glycosyltransferase family 2 protein [Paenibacillus tengchongensis]